MSAQDERKMRLFKKFGYDIGKAREFILRKADLAEGRILEIGTGMGHMTMALMKKGFSPVTIDLDKEMQKKARVNIAALGLKNKATLKIMNAENLSFKDKSFDTVVSVNFIHHASDPLKCVREMARVTRRGLVIADINKKGERIMEKVHKMEGQTHPRAKVSMIAMKELLEWLGLDVRSYRDTCQTVLVAEKGEKI